VFGTGSKFQNVGHVEGSAFSVVVFATASESDLMKLNYELGS
jgi:hypothetical protein